MVGGKRKKRDGDGRKSNGKKKTKKMKDEGKKSPPAEYAASVAHRSVLRNITVRSALVPSYKVGKHLKTFEILVGRDGRNWKQKIWSTDTVGLS